MDCNILIPEQSSDRRGSEKVTLMDEHMERPNRSGSKKVTSSNKDMKSSKLSRKDDVYCYALAKSLDRATCPVTVGLYAPWGRGKDMLLEKIEKFLSPRPSKSRELFSKLYQAINMFFIIPFFMIFYHPNPTEEHTKSWKNCYIFVRFSAWEYAGSDHIWAGLITNLCEHIEHEFGNLPISLYRALGGKSKIKNEVGKSLWMNKTFMWLPLWLFSLLIIILGVCALILFLMYGFQFDDPLGMIVSIFEGAGVSILVISARLPIVRTCVTLVNSVFTQKVKIKRKLNHTDMSSQLGFMNDVKKEVNVIINYLHFMEIFLKVKIRVVIEITKLDICMPDKVVGVLNAMNVLLSDPKAPFISILAVDPSVIVQCVEESDLLKGMDKNGYQYLNRTVALPFCIPQMDKFTKSQFLNQSEKHSNSESEGQYKKQTPSVCKDSKKDPCEELLVDDVLEEKAESLTHEALKFFSIVENDISSDEEDISSDEEDISNMKYVADNIIHMKRIVNTISISIRLMINKSPNDYIEKKTMKVAKWVLLTTQWPCRMSWIIQVVEDEVQRMSNDDKMKEAEMDEMNNITVWEVFDTFLEQLDNMKSDLKNLLEMDGDPEIFHKLLTCEEDILTFGDVRKLKKVTVNLDHSIKRQMELLLGSYNLLKFKNVEKLTPWSLLKMNTDDVCNKIKNIFLKEYMKEKKIEELNGEAKKDYEETREKEIEEYLKRIKDNNLNGRAIVCSNNEALSKALQMKMGDWTIFCLYFLNLPTPKIAY